jgi:hypothetical protein
MTTCMRGKLSRLIGLARKESWWGLRNLTYNFLRYLHWHDSDGCLKIQKNRSTTGALFRVAAPC